MSKMDAKSQKTSTRPQHKGRKMEEVTTADVGQAAVVARSAKVAATAADKPAPPKKPVAVKKAKTNINIKPGTKPGAGHRPPMPM